MCLPLSESCRLVKGSKQASIRITSEQRTEHPFGIRRLRRVCPIQLKSSAGVIRNKSGTAEVIMRLCLLVQGQRRFFRIRCHCEPVRTLAWQSVPLMTSGGIDEYHDPRSYAK